ncbi:MAG: hypothetical protein OEW48_14990 [Phycisphaerae bacterium]|nr:hypothetical protein [Phycisphaerae bacterium]
MKTKMPAINKKTLKWFLILVFVCFLGFINLYYLYAFQSTKRITSKRFLLVKPVESFKSPMWSHGNGCSVKIFRIPNHLQNYFTKPPSTFFDYPLAPLPRKRFWESVYVKKWTTGTPAKEEANLVQNALKNWNIPAALMETVLMSMTIETSHHAYVGHGQPRTGQSYNPAIFDYFILDPVNSWLIIISHVT